MLAVTSHVPYVRLAAPEDQDSIMEMSRMVHQECGLRTSDNKPLPLSERKVGDLIEKAASKVSPLDPGEVWIGVIDNGTQLEGSVAIAMNNTWYSEVPHLVEIWTVVVPEFRKATMFTKNFDMLLDFSKAAAVALKLPLLMGFMSAERQPAKRRLYERSFGVQPYGEYFVFNGEGVFTARQERRKHVESRGLLQRNVAQ